MNARFFFRKLEIHYNVIEIFFFIFNTKLKIKIYFNYNNKQL